MTKRHNYIRPIFWAMTSGYDPQSTGNEIINRQMVKSLCTTKETISRMKRHCLPFLLILSRVYSGFMIHGDAITNILL